MDNAEFNALFADNNNVGTALLARRMDEIQKATAASQSSLRLEELAGLAVERALRASKREYAVIGGKAAATLIERLHRGVSNHNKELAYSTSDWDIVVRPSDFESVAGDVVSAVFSATGIRLSEQTYKLSGKVIYLFGYLHARVFTSLADFHVEDQLPPTVLLSGVKYASTKWLLDELNKTIEQHSSSNEALKYLKRTKRRQLLRQMTPNRVEQSLGIY